MPIKTLKYAGLSAKMGNGEDSLSMQVSLARRALFKGKFSAPLFSSIRPPWALDEAAFLNACTRCDACVSACDEGIISRGDGGYPQINFQAGSCTFCGECADVCQDKALSSPVPDTAPWDLGARIGDGCLSANGVTCRVCGERCDLSELNEREA